MSRTEDEMQGYCDRLLADGQAAARERDRLREEIADLRAGRRCDVSPVTLPGDLVSPVAGALLRRGAVVPDAGRWPDGTALVSGLPEAGRTRIQLAHIGDIEPAWCDLDLSDPAGMDLAARWLAVHHGLTVGATAPSWTRSEDLDEWALWGRGPEWYYTTDLTDPAEALRAACLAAVGRTT